MNVDGRRLDDGIELRKRMRFVKRQLNKSEEYLDPDCDCRTTLYETHKLIKYFIKFIEELYKIERENIP